MFLLNLFFCCWSTDTVDYDLGTDVCERSEHEKMRMVVLLHHGGYPTNKQKWVRNNPWT